MAHIGGLVLPVLFFGANLLRSCATLRRWNGAVDSVPCGCASGNRTGVLPLETTRSRSLRLPDEGADCGGAGSEGYGRPGRSGGPIGLGNRFHSLITARMRARLGQSGSSEFLRLRCVGASCSIAAIPYTQAVS